MANKYGLDLDSAWRQVLREAASDEIVDVLRLEDSKLAWLQIRAHLEDQLNADSYRPAPPRLVEVPKDGFVVRPFARLAPRDWVVYEAVVAKLAPCIDHALPDEVKSARLDKSARRPGNQIDAWIAFQAAGRALYVEDELGFMLSTDVSSYFEYVELGILINDLRALPGIDYQALNLLSSILNEFVRSSDVWGLPQGPEASAILGNFYLLPLDRELHQHPVKFVRYQDDIKILADNKAVLRVALQHAIRILRGRHLNVSVQKTKMLEGPQILDEFEDTRKDAIQYGIKIGSSDAPAQLRALFEDATAVTPVKARDIRFAVYRLGKVEDDCAVAWILDHLPEVPYLSGLLVAYLSLNMATHPEIEDRTRTYLTDGNENVYPWVEFNLMRMFARADSISDPTLDVVWATLRDGNKDLLVRQHAARCVGRHARPGDIALLRQLFNQSTDATIQRALLVAMTDATHGHPDRAYLGAESVSHPNLEHTCAYLKSGAKIPDP